MKKHPIRRALARTLRGSPALAALLLLSVCGAVALALAPPQLLRAIIDRGLVGGDRGALPGYAAAYLAVLAAAGLAELTKEGTLSVLGQRLLCAVRRDMMEKLTCVRAGFFSENEGGAVVARLTADVDAVGALFSGGVVGMAVDLCKLVGIVVSIWLFSAGLGVLTLALLPGIALVTRAFQKRMLGAQVENRVQLARVTGRIGETLANRRTVKACAKEGYMEARYADCLAENFRTIDRVNHLDALFSCVVQAVRAAMIAAVVLLTARGEGAFGVTVGMLAASIELIAGLFAPIENLGTELDNIQKAAAGVRRVGAFFEEPERPAYDPALTAAALVPDRARLTVELQDVSFAYDADTPVLRGVSLRVEAGARVTFAGRTGAGKTTLFRLLLGQLDPDAGAVLVCGRDVRRIPPAARRAVFGYVDQGCLLIAGTVAEQVSLRDARVSRGQVTRALRLVGLWDTVERLPRGMDTPLTGGGGLSRGERQLLAIARAIVLDPPLLLLDEITAGLDAVTEQRLNEALARAGEGRTILSISHRMSGLRPDDTVVLLADGRISGRMTAAAYEESRRAAQKWDGEPS